MYSNFLKKSLMSYSPNPTKFERWALINNDDIIARDDTWILNRPRMNLLVYLWSCLESFAKKDPSPFYRDARIFYFDPDRN